MGASPPMMPDSWTSSSSISSGRAVVGDSGTVSTEGLGLSARKSNGQPRARERTGPGSRSAVHDVLCCLRYRAAAGLKLTGSAGADMRAGCSPGSCSNNKQDGGGVV